MNFTRTTQYAETSECGRYSVASYKADGKYVFQAWRIEKPASALLKTGTAQECRAACEVDAAAAPVPELDFINRQASVL